MTSGRAHIFSPFQHLPPVTVMALDDVVRDVADRYASGEIRRVVAERLLGTLILEPPIPKSSLCYQRERELRGAGYVRVTQRVVRRQISISDVFQACLRSEGWGAQH
jgi:hypothetical protein